MGSRSLLQGIFPTQGSNPGLPHCRQFLYCLNYQGSKSSQSLIQKLCIWLHSEQFTEQAWLPFTNSLSHSFFLMLWVHAQLCLTFCDPMGCSLPWTAPLTMGFSRQEYWSGLPFPSPGDLPNPGIKPRSPTLQADSLPT